MTAAPISPRTTALFHMMLRSTFDGEVMSARNAFVRSLASDGYDPHGIVLAPASSPPRIVAVWHAQHEANSLRSDRAKAEWCARYGVSDLTEKEQAFVGDLAKCLGRYGGHATDRQAEWLEAIFARLRRAAA